MTCDAAQMSASAWSVDLKSLKKGGQQLSFDYDSDKDTGTGPVKKEAAN